MNFDLEERDKKFAIIHCNTNAVGVEGTEFMKLLITQVVKLTNQPDLRVVIDLKDTAEIDSETLGRVAALGVQLIAMKKKIYFVNVPVATCALVGEKGLETFVHMLYSSPVKNEAQKPVGQLDAEKDLIEGLREGIFGVFQMLCPSISLNSGTPFVKGVGVSVSSDISAQVGMRAKNFDGTLVISFPEAFYLKMVGDMHDTEYQSLAEASDDAASELLNILRSLSRKRLHEKGYQISKDIPAIVKGPLTEKLLANSDCVIALPFESDRGSFHLQVGISYRKSP